VLVFKKVPFDKKKEGTFFKKEPSFFKNQASFPVRSFVKAKLFENFLKKKPFFEIRPYMADLNIITI